MLPHVPYAVGIIVLACYAIYLIVTRQEERLAEAETENRFLRGKLLGGDTPRVASPMSCPSCGEMNRTSGHYCRMCGVALEAPQFRNPTHLDMVRMEGRLPVTQ